MACGHNPPSYSTMEQLGKQEMGTGTEEKCDNRRQWKRKK